MTQQADTREQALSYVRHQASKTMSDLAALLERTAADCERCLEGMSEAQATFRPALSGAEGYDEEWSVKEVLGHLIPATKDVTRRVAALAAGRPGAPVGRAGETSGGDRPIEAMRRALAEVWSETVRLVSSLPEDAGPGPTREHPMFGALNGKEWIAFQRLHAMDHVQQMEKVKAHPDYPKG